MYSQTTIITNKSGLHARPLHDFVSKAKEFESSIKVKKTDGNESYNAKSIMLLLSMGISKGTEVEISAEGGDDKKAVESLIELIESKFGEED